MSNSANPPSLPGTLSRPDAQRIIDALNLRLWEAERKIEALEAKPSLAGEVESNGTRGAGEGFTSEKTATGTYKISLSTESATLSACVPVVIAGGGEAALIFSSGPSKKTFTISTVTTGGVAKDGAFQFVIKAT